MDDQSPGRRAALAAGSHRTENNPRNRYFEIRTGRNDDGIIPSQFQDGFAQSGGNPLSNVSAHPGRSSCRNQGKATISDKGFSDLLVAADDKIHHSFRHPVFL